VSFWAGFFAGVVTVYVVSTIALVLLIRHLDRRARAAKPRDAIVLEEWFNDGGEVYRWTTEIPFSHVTSIADRVKGGG
jgi:hypothetical protein